MKRIAVLSNLVFLVVFLATIPMLVQAQATKSPAAKPTVKKVVTVSANDELIKLAQAGMSEEILLATVAKTDKSRYNTSVDALLKLKDAGVSQQVIAAVLGISSASSASTTRAESSGTPADREPQTKHIAVSMEQTSTRSADGSREAGIYLDQGQGLVQLEPSVYSGGKTSNKLLAIIPVVGKAQLKAVVRSRSADQRLQTSTPVFYFYFENRGAGLSNTGGTFSGLMAGASSPNEFILARLKVSKGERELIIAESTHFKDRTGVRPEESVDFVIKKLRAGVYEVRPRNPLTAGEYCFFYQGGSAVTAQTATGKLFDFGVDPGASSR